MIPDDAKELIKKFAVSGVKTPICLVGAKGVGKSFVVRDSAQELGWGFIDVRLSLDTPEDIAGWPRPKDDSVYYLMSDWAKETFSHDKVILFFDEVNRSQLETRQALFELMTEYKIRRKPINPNSYIVFAMNPDNGNYQVETLDSAFERRMVRLAVEPDEENWLNWAKETKVLNTVQEYIRDNKKMLFVAEKFEIKAEPNPDAWRMLGDIISKVNLTRVELLEVGSGLVGRTAITSYIKYIGDKKKPVTAEELIEHREEVNKRFIAQTNDSMASTFAQIKDYFDKESNKTAKKYLTFMQIIADGSLKDEFACALLMAVDFSLFEEKSIKAWRESEPELAELTKRIQKRFKYRKNEQDTPAENLKKETK